MPGIDRKGFILKALYRRWRRPCSFEPGYTVLLPTPTDMPFLLRYALEGLRHVDTSRCRQILVIPDGRGNDGGEGLRRAAAEFDDPRVEVVGLGPVDRFVVDRMRGGGSALHWLAIVRGVEHARCGHAFLHDADAFLVDREGVERQYEECLARGMDSLGVTPRWDPFFADLGYAIPGTWELMFSTRWARRHPPYDHKGRWRQTPLGAHEFDTMLYPQFVDYPAGRVGVLASPQELVHFHGTIVTYRVFRDSAAGSPVVDEIFRILLLALLEELVPGGDGRRALPAVESLARGLTDPSAPVTYGTAGAARAYPEFRAMIDRLGEAPTFAGARAERLRALLRPFDDHFAQARVHDGAEAGAPRARRDGLG